MLATCILTMARWRRCGATRSGWFLKANARRLRAEFLGTARRRKSQLAGDRLGLDGRQFFDQRLADRREQGFGRRFRGSVGQPVLGGDRVGRNLDAAGMQLIGNGEIVERDMRARGRRLVGRRCGDEFVEQRSEVAIPVRRS